MWLKFIFKINFTFSKTFFSVLIRKIRTIHVTYSISTGQEYYRAEVGNFFLVKAQIVNILGFAAIWSLFQLLISTRIA